MGRNPLGHASGSTLGYPSEEVREAGLPADLVPNTVSRARGRLLGQAIGKLILGHPLVSRNPQESDRIASGEKPWCACYLLFGIPLRVES